MFLVFTLFPRHFKTKDQSKAVWFVAFVPRLKGWPLFFLLPLLRETTGNMEEIRCLYRYVLHLFHPQKYLPVSCSCCYSFFFMLILPYNTNIHLNTHIHTDLEHPMPCSVPTQCSVSSYSLGLVLSSSCLIDAELRTAFAPRFFFLKQWTKPRTESLGQLLPHVAVQKH